MISDLFTSRDICLRHNVMCHVTGKQLKMLSHETVHRNWIKLVATEKALNSQKCLITLYIVGWVKISAGSLEIFDFFFTDMFIE